MDIKKIKLIIFDGNQILYNAKPAAIEFNKLFENFLKKNNSKFSLITAGKLWSKIQKVAEKNKLNSKDAKIIYLSELRLSECINEYEEIESKAMEKAERLDQDGPKVLELLKKSYILSVLSDTTRKPKELRAFLNRIGFDNIFDTIFTSSSIHFAKPDPRSYYKVLDHYSLNPEEALFIGHDDEELEGAKNIKMNVIAYSIQHKNCLSINKLTELITIMKN